jgi:hypothetical protein
MSNGVPCAVCMMSETAHDMAIVYRKKGWYPQCRHPYVSQCDVEDDESAASADRRGRGRKRR